MKALFLQLGRPLDIAHCLPALQSFIRAQERALERDKEIAKEDILELKQVQLVVRDTYLEAANFVAESLEKIFARPVIKVIAFPTVLILGKALESPEQKTQALAHIITWLADNILEGTKVHGPYDLLINLTYSDSSSYLAQLIPAHEVRGYHRAHDGELAIDDGWSRYICSQVQRSHMNILHMTDLFSRVCAAPQTAEHTQARQVLSSVAREQTSSGACAVIDMGRSETGPSIREELFLSIARELLASSPSSEITLVGDANQSALMRAWHEKLSEGERRRCGILPKRLSLGEKMKLVASLPNESVYIAQNQHRAFITSFLNRRIVMLSGGNQRREELCAYGENHVFIEFQKDPGSSQESLEALLAARTQAVMTVVNAALAANAPLEFSPAQLASLNQRVLISQGKIAACNDGTLRHTEVALNFRKDEVTNFFEQTYYLIAEFRNSGRYEDLPVPKLGNPDEQPQALDLLLNTFDALIASQKLAGYGAQTCIEMLKNADDREQLATLGARIGEVESLLKTMKESVTHIRPLIDSWEVSKDTITGENIVELAAKTEASFREFNQNIDLVKELMELAINHAKEQPLAVAAEAAHAGPEESAPIPHV